MDNPSHRPAPSPDERFGGHRLVEELGRGAIGVVFRAVDGQGRSCALKRPLSPERSRAVQREARLLRELCHPNIVLLRAEGASDGVPYFTMPVLEGMSLRTRWQQLWGPSGRRGTLSCTTSVGAAELAASHVPPVRTCPQSDRPEAAAGALREVLDISAGVARALSYLAQCGVAHCDVKPANVMLTKGVPILIDFNVARAARLVVPCGTPREDVARAGTVGYAAPEQLGGRAACVSDLYALGSVLYELLTGRAPFEGGRHVVAAQHAGSLPLPPSHFVFGLPAGLDELVLALLAKDPWRRPLDAAERLAAFAANCGTSGGEPCDPLLSSSPVHHVDGRSHTRAHGALGARARVHERATARAPQ
jgi:eukaryotic-like serine/threonine-protein kinase